MPHGNIYLHADVLHKGKLYSITERRHGINDSISKAESISALEDAIDMELHFNDWFNNDCGIITLSLKKGEIESGRLNLHLFMMELDFLYTCFTYFS